LLLARPPYVSLQASHVAMYSLATLGLLTIGSSVCGGDRCRAPGSHQRRDARHVPMKVFHVALARCLVYFGRPQHPLCSGALCLLPLSHALRLCPALALAASAHCSGPSLRGAFRLPVGGPSITGNECSRVSCCTPSGLLATLTCRPFSAACGRAFDHR